MEPQQEKAIFKALLYSGDSDSRAWTQLYSLLLQLKFVSDGVSVKLLAIHEQRQEVVYELSLSGEIVASMKADFVQWHRISQSAPAEAFGARFLTSSEADTFHSCFQQLLEAVLQKQSQTRRLSDISRPAVIPHPSVRLPASLQLSVLLPDGRRVSELASHGTKLRDLLRKVCKREGLSYKHHYLKPEKLRLDPEPAPLDNNRTIGEVKISKLQLLDRRAERDKPGAKLSFSNPWGGNEGRQGGNQVQLLQGRFNKLDNFSQPIGPGETMEFHSPARGSVPGAEQVVSPADSLDESEISAPFRACLLEDRPKRSSSLRTRMLRAESELDQRPLKSSPTQSPRAPRAHRGTFSESDIRGAVTRSSDPNLRPSTPTRRRAPRPPQDKPLVPEPKDSIEPIEPIERLDSVERKTVEGGGTMRNKKSQVSLFKVSEEVTNQLQDEFSQRLVERQSRSPDKIRSGKDNLSAGQNQESADSGFGPETGNSLGDLPSGQDRSLLEEAVPLASSTPDKRVPVIKPKPQIAPKPSRLVQAGNKPANPARTSFPLYPSTPATEDLLVSDNRTVRGVAGRVDKWRSHLNRLSKEAEDTSSDQLVFHPHTTGVSENGALVFHLPPPPADSPPSTPPPLRLDYQDDSQPDALTLKPFSIIPPPLDDISQSDSESSSPPSHNSDEPASLSVQFDDVITITRENEFIPRVEDNDIRNFMDDMVTSIDEFHDITPLPYDREELACSNNEVIGGDAAGLITRQDIMGYDDVTDPDELIVLPPPSFYNIEFSESQFTQETLPTSEFSTPQFPPPTPLRMSLNLDLLPDSPSDLPPPPRPPETMMEDRNVLDNEKDVNDLIMNMRRDSELSGDDNDVKEWLVTDKEDRNVEMKLATDKEDRNVEMRLVTDKEDRHSGEERRSRLAELLTAAAESLTGDRESAQASELVREALQLINQRGAQALESHPESLVRASYHRTDEEAEYASRTAPDFSRFGPNFQACMQDIRSDNSTALKPSQDPLSPATATQDLDTSLDTEQSDVASALARVMKERRLLLEQTSTSRLGDMMEPVNRTLSDDWI